LMEQSAQVRKVGQFGPVVWPPLCWRKVALASISAASMGGMRWPRVLLAQEFTKREKAWKPPEGRIKTGYLAKYATMATSAGAVLKW
jgi:hypothetical protein